jgi:multidrug resistance efflux pump
MRIDRNDLELAIAAKDAAVASAKARAIQTAADEARYRTLLDAGVATRQNYDQVEAVADTARAELRQAMAEAQVSRLSSAARWPATISTSTFTPAPSGRWWGF